MIYEELFERNWGIFSPQEQDRIRKGKVVIIGCGGIGGVVAVVLARSGVTKFVLMEHDTFNHSNMNRQVTCFCDTLGQNKALALRDQILRINPEAEVTTSTEPVSPDQIDDVIRMGDVFIPAADDWALSILALGRAKELGVPAIMAYPVGAFGRVSTFLPDSPYAAECLVMPYKSGYEVLKHFQNKPDNRRILLYYKSLGAWTDEWFEAWCEGQKPHPQLCTIVWTCGSLAALEIIKLLSGKWKPVAAPRYWHITPESTRIAKFGWGRRLLSRASRRKFTQALLPLLAERPWLLKAFTRAIS